MTVRSVRGGLPIGGKKRYPGRGRLPPHVWGSHIQGSLEGRYQICGRPGVGKAGKVDMTFDVQGVGTPAPMPGGSWNDISGQSSHKM